MADEKNAIAPQKTHLFEIDLIRAITVFSVVSLHSLSYTKFLLSEPAEVFIFGIVGHGLNYNRQVFMFVTAFVLTYVYFHRSFSKTQFWRRRMLVVFVPYILWSLLYVRFAHQGADIFTYLQISFKAILTGEASFQLYYILLTVQFYAVFPYFLALIKKLRPYVIPVLVISFLLQLLYMAFDHHYIQTGMLQVPESLKEFVLYRDRIFLIYQFFFLLGSFAAIHFDKIREVLVRFRYSVVSLFVVSYILYSYYFHLQLHVQEISWSRATGALQPSVVLYSITAILLFLLVAILWARKRRFLPLVTVISQTSFGIYLIHVFVLTFVVRLLLPYLPDVIPVPFRMIFVMLTAFSLSTVLSYILLKIPGLGWTIGRVKGRKPVTSG